MGLFDKIFAKSKSNEANLVNVALIQIITKIIKKVFKNSQKACSKYIATDAK